MSIEDYEAKMRAPKKKSRLQAFLPVLGLLLMVVAGAIAYFARVPAYEALANAGLFAQVTAPREQLEIVVAVVVWLVVIMLTAVVFAIMQPRDETKKLVSEKALMKEREDKEAEQRARKRRQAEMRRKMKQRDRNN